MKNEMLAWHFLPNNGRFRYGDNNKVETGYVYSVKPPLELCGWGLHASVKIHDALRYAPGSMLGRVVLSGYIVYGVDKLCATHREYLWLENAETVLRDHARWCALQVIEHWDAPDIVQRYLESGDESFRAAARAATWDASRAAAWNAARDAAWNAARGAAWEAARDAAWHAARPAARDAAWNAAWEAARDAAWHAARDAAWDAQNADLESRLFSMGAPKEIQ